jgi:hypothetical protein
VKTIGAVSRVIGHRTGGAPGRTLILVGGLHGNEPAGVEALRRVFARLPESSELRGEVLAVAGNVSALERGVRYVDTDLNRGWWPESLDAGDVPGSVEDAERRALLATMSPVLDRAPSAPIVVDLHTTSGETPPFATLGDTLRNRRFAFAFPLPVVLGLEEQLAATFLEYVNNLGCVTVGFEGGRHEDPAAVDHLEAVSWIALVTAGIVRRHDVPPPDPWAFLEDVSRGRPAVVEVLYRHAVPADRSFVMERGYRSFQEIRAGERLGAWVDGGPVLAPEAGRILMPLYQDQGDDGFFIIRDVRRAWLRLSAFLRRIGADRVAPALPGVRRHPYMAGAVVIDRRIARWYTVEVFHLLGFRRRIESGPELIMARRHFDARPYWNDLDPPPDPGPDPASGSGA